MNPDLPLAHNLTAQLDIDRGPRARRHGEAARSGGAARSTDPELFAGLVYACRYCGLLGAVAAGRMRAARRLDPSIKTSVIHTLWMLREYEAVLASTVEAAARRRASRSWRSGGDAEALEFLAEKEQEGAGEDRADRRRPAGAAGRPSGTKSIADSGAWRRPISAIPRASITSRRQLAHAGAAEDAVGLLERATAAGFFCYPVFAADAWLDPVRDLPAFVAVLRRAKDEHELAVAAFAAAGGDRILRG